MSLPDAPVVDAHVHVRAPDYLLAALRMFWAEGAAYRRPGPGQTTDEIYQPVLPGIKGPDAEHLLAAMDIACVSQNLNLGIDNGPEEGASTRLMAHDDENAAARWVQEHPDTGPNHLCVRAGQLRDQRADAPLRRLAGALTGL